VNVPSPAGPQEAAAVTKAALGLAGHSVDPFTRELTDKMGRGELTADQAVEAILARVAAQPA
jgi:hypothetical protein